MRVARHDPRLAREVYRVYASLAGKRDSRSAYWKWLRRYVHPLAGILEERGVIRIEDPYSTRTLQVKLPSRLHRELSMVSREAGIPLQRLVRLALERLLADLGVDGRDTK